VKKKAPLPFFSLSQKSVSSLFICIVEYGRWKKIKN